jgi:putative transposase
MKPARAENRHKAIRLRPENYIGLKYYFVTLCAFERQRYFQDDGMARWIVAQLHNQAARNGFAVRAYCVMPDHVHLLVLGQSLHADLLKFIAAFKHKTSFGFRRTAGKQLWQTSFYDHVLRAEDEPGRVAWYIWLNPVRAGLVKKVKEYPYAGPFGTDWEGANCPEKLWAPPGRGIEKQE